MIGHALQQNSTFPPIKCFTCADMKISAAEENHSAFCRQNLNLLRYDPQNTRSFATEYMRSPRVWGMDGLVLPQQPYCFTYILQFKKDGAVLNYLVRSGGWPGYKPPTGCIKEEMTTKNPLEAINQYPTLKYYIFCSTNLCNNIGQDEFTRQCFAKDEDFNPPKTIFAQKRDAENSDGAAVSCDRRMLSCLTIISITLGGFSLGRCTVLVGLAGFLVRSADALQCYACADDGRPASQLLPCYNVLAQGKELPSTVNCPDRYPPPNGYDMVWLQKGYCATWLNRMPTPTKGAYVDFINRGCVYPGGEPDNCLEVNMEPPTPQPGVPQWSPRLRVVKYCRTDRCNSETFTAFVAECIDKTLTTRDLSSVMTTPSTPTTPMPTIPTRKPTLNKYFVEDDDVDDGWPIRPWFNWDDEMDKDRKRDKKISEEAERRKLEKSNIPAWEQQRRIQEFLKEFEFNETKADTESHATRIIINFDVFLLPICMSCLSLFRLGEALP
ncbi:uncharacterized protein LOC129602671 isoform X2 [Paramacrobiotus metropolitanus]|uniref:uncharacterized protein LOC129602671 isoform X2 n=1 Tax=Paramacrobiotus metropolitanus TaxID=2943436 RepID=UPI002445B0B2|nr:uncharacterized protein LOC129602671 isoform X2 [Paramacrobiotus metropolitanus]